MEDNTTWIILFTSVGVMIGIGVSLSAILIIGDSHPIEITVISEPLEEEITPVLTVITDNPQFKEDFYTRSAVKCLAAYPSFCVSPYTPDLNCADIPDRNFIVQEPDPHKFDQDNDGIGCESR